MQGKIIKGIAGFYYVDTGSSGLITCKAKGGFRNDGISPLVGDNVELELVSDTEGNIMQILPRTNSLIRPAVANIDQALVVFATTKPEPNLNLLDRFLVTMRRQNIPTTIVFNKADIAEDAELDKLSKAYAGCGCRVMLASVLEDRGLEAIREVLKGKTTVLAGPSGVGKSSLMNRLQPDAHMEVGDLSRKIERGKQTTRHTELICIEEGTYLTDTPGFSSLFVVDIPKEELRDYFPEFSEYEPACRFQGCMHIKEPDCGIKEAVKAGLISQIRYDNYLLLYEELSKQIKYR